MKKFLFLMITLLCFCGAIFCAACESIKNNEGKGEESQEPLPQETPIEDPTEKEEQKEPSKEPSEEPQDDPSKEPESPQGEGQGQEKPPEKEEEPPKDPSKEGPSEEEQPPEEEPEECSHEFSDWQQVEPPTCTFEGKRKRECSLCGKEEEESVPKLQHNFDDPSPERKEPTCTFEGYILSHCQNEGCTETKRETLKALEHDFSTQKVTKEPTCEDKGEREKTCSLCGKTFKEEIPAAGHKYQTKRVEPTCTLDGKEENFCSVCRKSEIKTLPALGHSYGEERVTVQPTCSDAGEKVKECSLCSDIEKNVIPALGHDFSDTFTVDEIPTGDKMGSMSKHCKRLGCDERSEIKELDLNSKLPYSVKVMRTNGAPVEDLKSMPHIYISQGNKTLESNAGTSIKADLPIGEYTAEIEYIPEGFTVESNKITLTPNERECIFYLKANITKPYSTSSYSYSSVGSVLRDHSLLIVGSTPSENKTVTISSLLKEYKAIFINCYFTSCSPCMHEINDMVNAYLATDSLGNRYGDDVAMIMLPIGESEKIVRQFKNNPNLYSYTTEKTLPFMMAYQADFLNCITSGQFPTSYVIDCEGVVTYKHVGGLSKAQFTSAMEEHGLKYSQNLRAEEGNGGETLLAAPEAILPSKFWER